MAETYYINTERERQDCIAAIDNDGCYEVTIKPIKPEEYRSQKQNKAIHKYCSLLAGAYNEAGLDMQVVLAKQLAVPWSMERVKDNQWRQIQIALGYPESTTKLKTDQVTHVYETLNRHTSQNFGIGFAFPSEESQRIQSMIDSGQV